MCQVSTFTKVWATHEGGQDNLGATFFNPSSLPNNGFFMLGSYAQPNNKPLFGWILAAKDSSSGASSLAKPLDFTLVWSSESSNIKKDGNGYFWLPVAPDGYKSVGHVVTNTPDKPSVDNFRCVRDEFTDQCENDAQIWSIDEDGFSVYGLRPATRTIQSLGMWVGTFAAQPKNSSNSSSMISSLKNKNSNFSAMPNLKQIQALVQTYSPVIYFHPDEIYLPSSTSWFFDNGGLLYQKDSPSPSRIDPTGSNLPQGGSNDGQYWLDLPADDNAKEAVKKGNIPSSRPYLHIKPMLGATFTDIAMWVYYPFNGPARAKVGFLNIKLGRIGEHVGDWEHVTLRISNFTGELWRAYFAEHSSGTWVDASQLEFDNGNKFVAYSSLSGHAFYPKAGLYLQGDSDLGIGIRNDAAKGKDSMDTGAEYQVVAAEYLGTESVVEPPWLNYMREWGPKVAYNIASELKDVERILPRKLRRALENFVRSLPEELLGEEGPTGPKVKPSWTMDEKD